MYRIVLIANFYNLLSFLNVTFKFEQNSFIW